MCIAFYLQVLKAGESTTFDVIFLARMVEDVQTTLYIQTSLGTFDYKVSTQHNQGGVCPLLVLLLADFTCNKSGTVTDSDFPQKLCSC